MANPKYKVVIFNFADTTTFGLGTPLAVLSSATNVGWSEYGNEVSEAYFTLSQEDSAIAVLSGDAVKYGYHCRIYRDGVLVWGGWLGEVDEGLNDVVFTAYSYLSGFYHYAMPWDQSWVGQDADQIVEDAFDYAKGLSKSRVGWITKGTIEHLYVESGGPTTLQMPLYKATYKRPLTVFREMAAYAISDTTNHVIFEVTPSGTFNLWKNRGSSINSKMWSLGRYIRTFRRVRLPVDTRNEILVVGSSPTDTTLRFTATDATTRDAGGLKEEPIFLSWVKDEDELERVAAIRLTKAKRIDTTLYISLFKNTVIPARATNASYAIGDTVHVGIDRGMTQVSLAGSEPKFIAGHQVIYQNGDEFVRLLLADDLG